MSLWWGENKLQHVLDKGIGYYLVTLISDTGVRRNWFIHRLLAINFIPNPDNKPVVNHKDADKTNNRLENLEWVTQKENARHAADLGLYNSPTKEVVAVDMVTKEIVKVYASIREATKDTGAFGSNIKKVAEGKRKHAGGFLWEYL